MVTERDMEIVEGFRDATNTINAANTASDKTPMIAHFIAMPNIRPLSNQTCKSLPLVTRNVDTTEVSGFYQSQYIASSLGLHI